VRAVELRREIAAERHGQLERLAGVAQVGLPGGRNVRRVRERGQVRAYVVAALLARDEAERREDARCGRHEHGRDLELVRELTRVERPRSTERDQREVARVVAALHRDEADRAQHLGVRNPHSILGGDLAERRLGGASVELEPARKLIRKPPEQEIGVRHGRPRPAEAIARRARVRPRALRACTQRAPRVPPDDGTPAGADGLEVDRRYADREPADGALGRAPRRSGRNQGDIRRGSAHVERDRAFEAGEPGNERRANRAGRGARDEHRRRVSGALLEACDTARRAHDERRGKPRLRAAVPQRREIPGDDRAEVRVGHRRRRALVLAELGRDLVRGDHARTRQPPPELARDRRLVLGMAEREQEADRDGLGIELGERVEIEGLEDAVGPKPLANPVAVLESNQRLGVPLAQAVEVRSRLPAQVQQVLESHGCDERRPRALPLEQRVRGDGRPVREALDVRRADGARRRDD
jgi:hypothetical protein